MLCFVALAVIPGLVLGGCAGSQKPVLYPNAKVQQVGKEQAGREIADGRRLAGEYVQSIAAKDIGKDAAVGGCRVRHYSVMVLASGA